MRADSPWASAKEQPDFKELKMAWIHGWWDRAKAKKDDALSQIRDYKAVFEEAVIAADAAGSTYPQALVPNVLARFDQLEAKVAQAETRTQIEKLVEQAAALARLRAYVCPPKEIKIEGQTALNTMEEWSVPAGALDSLKKEVVPQLSKTDDIEAARGALHTVFEEYDSWSDFIDEYNNEMRKVAYWLAAFILVSLGSAVFLLSSGFVIWGLLSASACGAFVSVIAKMPALSVSGDSAPYKRGIWRRVCTGLAAGVIGSGFLVSGIVTITLPQGGSLPGMIDACAPPAALHEGAAKASVTQPSESTPAKPGRRAGCKTGDVLVLVALVMLFGLSERALTSFEERVFPSKP